MNMMQGFGEPKPAFSPTTEQLVSVTNDLVRFVHRVADSENASPAEIAALPEIAKVLYRVFTIS